MAPGFLDMPAEVRNQIYRLLLVDEEPIDPFAFQSDAIGLFRTNKHISRESMSILYSQNCFDFTSRCSANILSFLDGIQQNAGMIINLYMGCPEVSLSDSYVAILDNVDGAFLSEIQSCCPSVKSLTLSWTSTSSMIRKFDSLGALDLIREILARLDRRLRSFASLQKIHVEISEDESDDRVASEMIRQGWIALKKEVPEHEMHTSFSDLGHSNGWGDSDYHSDDDADDYDIDNDSDFWRRADD